MDFCEFCLDILNVKLEKVKYIVITAWGKNLSNY